MEKNPGIWERLGLEPTRDSRAIKRAYAKRVKQHHPEERPEEFGLLHDAYRRALHWAETGNLPEVAASSAPPTPEPPIYDFESLMAAGFRQQWRDSHSQCERVIEEMEALYRDPIGRRDMARWMQLLRSRQFRQVMHAVPFLDRLALFFVDHPGLPNKVWVEFYRAYGFAGLEEQRDKGAYEALFYVLHERYQPYVEGRAGPYWRKGRTLGGYSVRSFLIIPAGIGFWLVLMALIKKGPVVVLPLLPPAVLWWWGIRKKKLGGLWERFRAWSGRERLAVGATAILALLFLQGVFSWGIFTGMDPGVRLSLVLFLRELQLCCGAGVAAAVCGQLM